MGEFLGLAPTTAHSKGSAIRVSIATLDHLIVELGTTHTAALHPHSHGIDPGETTISPWSIGSVLDARNELKAARAAANEMMLRLSAEITAQERVSANARGIHGSANGHIPHHSGVTGEGTISAAGSNTRAVADSYPVSVARGVLLFDSATNGVLSIMQFPAAITLLAKSPKLWIYDVKESPFRLSAYNKGARFLTQYADLSGNWFIRNSFRAAGALEASSLLTSAGDLLTNASSQSSKWLPKAAQLLHTGADFLDKAMPIAGKALAGLGVVVGVIDLGTGIAGAMDGDVSSDDAWAIADGAVGIICGIGAFAPPPVGVVFAAVGAAYSLGRFLFTPGDDGKTPLDHMGSFFTDVGRNINQGVDQAGKAVHAAVDAGIKTAQTTVKNVAKVIDAGLETAGKVFDSLWPW